MGRETVFLKKLKGFSLRSKGIKKYFVVRLILDFVNIGSVINCNLDHVKKKSYERLKFNMVTNLWLHFTVHLPDFSGTIKASAK